ncbi:MAG: glycosyl hydrolase [Bacteroidales bacterium]
MKRHILVVLLVSGLALPGLAAVLLRAAPPPPALRLPSSSEVRALFANPPADYSTAPLWVWNDMLTDDMVVGTLRDLAGQKVKAVFVHPRPGLMTPYLSAEWFRLWKVALAEAARLDMKLWIYDENSYPSGFAGGFVPEAMPESQGLGLSLKDDTSPRWTDDTLAVFRVADAAAEDVSAQVKSGASLPAARYVVASVLRAAPGPWYGGKFYVDLLRPGVTEKFLAVTLDAYKREIGAEFGKRVPGSFTDEPELRPAGGLPWTGQLPGLFEKRWGYSLLPNLVALREPVGDWKKVRHDYYQLLLEQFIERWARPYFEYCQANGIEFTGHYWEHEWPNCGSVPDNMAMAAWQQRPGIDTLMNQYAEDTHAQFGNVRAPKEVASLANQLGRARTLAEGYGAGGWDLRFEDMKRIGDWLYVLGINTLDQHLSYVSLRGARKRDHPQSFSYHEPWWDAYHVQAEYFARLSAAMSAGEQVNQVLVLEPTTTAWMYNAAAKAPPELARIGETFQRLVVDLEKAQVEYDLGAEDVLARHGSVVGRALRVGRRDYTTVVLAPMTGTLNAATVNLLEKYLKAGGSVLACDGPPDRVEGAESKRGAALAALPGWKRVEPAELPARLLQAATGFAIAREPGDRGILYHHRRQLADGELLFLVNTSNEASTVGSVQASAGGVQEWDAATGGTRPYAFETSGRSLRVRFVLPPAGSLLLYLAKASLPSAPAPSGNFTPLPAAGAPEARRVGPNVLVLDYLDVRAGGEVREKTYFYQAAQFAFKQNGMERNPWDSAVQFRDELIARKFASGSGVTATYRFTIRDRVPAGLSAVVERPDLYTVRVNGTAVTAPKGSWWLDRSFGRIDIGREARVGENEVVLEASPFTIYHELEPVYILGEFALEAVESGFVIAADRPLTLAAWTAQGQPFYSQGVTYTETFDVARKDGEYRVQLRRWYGSVARVAVNGTPAGFVYAAPWSLDVTKLVRPGKNVIEVTVVGTLKNTLGPHHGEPSLGTAWPSMFQKGPTPGPPAGGRYSTVGYGLFEPFELAHAPARPGPPTSVE